MTSLAWAAHIIHHRFCRGSGDGITSPALACHDRTLHLYARMCAPALLYSQPLARMASPPSAERDLPRSLQATAITKSP